MKEPQKNPRVRNKGLLFTLSKLWNRSVILCEIQQNVRLLAAETNATRCHEQSRELSTLTSPFTQLSFNQTIYSRAIFLCHRKQNRKGSTSARNAADHRGKTSTPPENQTVCEPHRSRLPFFAHLHADADTGIQEIRVRRKLRGIIRISSSARGNSWAPLMTYK